MIAPPPKPQNLNGQALPGANVFYRGDAADEGIVIARLAFDGAFARRYAGVISVDLFRDPAWRRVFLAVQDELQYNEIVDPSAISRALRSGMSPEEAHVHLADLVDYGAFAESSATGALRRLVDQHRAKLVADVTETVTAQLGTPALSLDEAKTLLQETLTSVGGGIGRKLTTLADTMQSDPADEEHELIRTGVRWFDEKMPDDGLRPGDVMALSAPPGLGKTALVLQLTVSAVTTDPALRVLWCAGEMTEKSLRNRALSCLASLPVSILRRAWKDLSPLQEQAKRAAIDTLRDTGDRFSFVMAPLTPQAVEAGILATGARLVVVTTCSSCGRRRPVRAAGTTSTTSCGNWSAWRSRTDWR